MENIFNKISTILNEREESASKTNFLNKKVFDELVERLEINKGVVTGLVTFNEFVNIAPFIFINSDISNELELEYKNEEVDHDDYISSQEVLQNISLNLSNVTDLYHKAYVRTISNVIFSKDFIEKIKNDVKKNQEYYDKIVVEALQENKIGITASIAENKIWNDDHTRKKTVYDEIETKISLLDFDFNKMFKLKEVEDSFVLNSVKAEFYSSYEFKNNFNSTRVEHKEITRNTLTKAQKEQKYNKNDVSNKIDNKLKDKKITNELKM